MKFTTPFLDPENSPKTSAFKLKLKGGEPFLGPLSSAVFGDNIWPCAPCFSSFHCLSDRSWLQFFARKSPGTMDPMDLDHVGENGHALDKDIMFPPSFNPLKLSQLWVRLMLSTEAKSFTNSQQLNSKKHALAPKRNLFCSSNLTDVSCARKSANTKIFVAAAMEHFLTASCKVLTWVVLLEAKLFL